MIWKPKVERATSLGFSKEPTPRCYETHPPLKLGKGTLYGGNSSHPVKKAQIYVSLQQGSTCSRASDPWEPQAVVEIHYPMRDMHAPEDVPRFLKMIEWLCEQLDAGKRVHVGCFGGHGRTGVILAAIVAQMLEEKDAIQYVREHYCVKAVESAEQVAFLRKYYKVAKAAPAKTWASADSVGSTLWPSSGAPIFSKEGGSPSPVGPATKSYVPMASARSLWKRGDR
jgi:hypothetical protein